MKFKTPMQLPKPNALKNNRGKIVVICGPMFAGKSEELLRQLKRLEYSGVPYIIFKPQIDSRTKGTAKSRDGREMKAIVIKNSAEVKEHLKHIKVFPFVVAFDEAQFLDADIVNVVRDLAALKITVLVTGLDTDSNHQPFGPMGNLLAIADEVRKLTAICLNCGSDATRTYRIHKPEMVLDQILIGDTDSYEARCSNCFNIGRKKTELQREMMQSLKVAKDNFFSNQKPKNHF
ncbi:thymidine kinase [Mycoplasmoides fastidiosum]|uniref:Thymidine kinase n=1 Tax=Mycoplasmoides fastidiosum TaxID=92758 RepID=A0ABU0LYA7_9BACT|nr:thymidine kinase [Mycoplasmoides fastidiosum]MDQ0513696.1 thymidine kinase [Mycoplasmoides fastidiosum]UUD37881.1 thymidine kinase [Mycoplasmoides fastidiosum]